MQTIVIILIKYAKIVKYGANNIPSTMKFSVTNNWLN